MARYDSIRTLIAIAAQNNMKMKQFDVTTAFLYGTLEDEVYIYPPEGLNLEPNQALKLVKGLYGLKQAPRVWNNEFTRKIESLGFRATKSDKCIFKHEIKEICAYMSMMG